jgi:ethanolamine ammonia-lyase small subunit
MSEDHPQRMPDPEPLPLLKAIRERTPARLLPGRAGVSYRTATLLDLRRDHAAARDAVRRELDLDRDLGSELLTRYGLFEVATLAGSKEEYLLNPGRGRALSEPARERISRDCPARAELQVVIADGLSVDAVAAQVPRLLPLLEQEARRRGWSFGRPFVVRHGRVGVLNDVGAILDPLVVVLLIGERPGLATAESLSAYLAYRPRPGDTDARRNLISNIHARGVPVELAAARIARLAEAMRRAGTSGVSVKEGLDGPPAAESPPGRLQS